MGACVMRVSGLRISQLVHKVMNTSASLRNRPTWSPEEETKRKNDKKSYGIMANEAEKANYGYESWFNNEKDVLKRVPSFIRSTMAEGKHKRRSQISMAVTRF